MSGGDIALYSGMIFGAWGIGFAGGYLIAVFRRALEQAG